MPLDPKQQPPYYTPGTTPTPTVQPSPQSIYALTQVGTNAPTATPIQTQAGTIASTSRSSTGAYRLTFTGTPLTTNKTSIQIENANNQTAGLISAVVIDTNKIDITTKWLTTDGVDVFWTAIDDILLGTYIIITVTP